MHPYQVLAEPVRRRIVEVLASGDHSSGELSDAIGREFNLTRQAISHHLTILRVNGWVDWRYEWSNRVYWLDPEGFRSLFDEVDLFRYLWARRIGHLAFNDPQPHHAAPFMPRTYPRAEPGRSTRGLRGRRPNIWQGQSDAPRIRLRHDVDDDPPPPRDRE